MMLTIQELEQASVTATQRSREWHKARLGKFTGSQVGRLMKRGRGKDAEWSADALAYIREVAAERLINPVVLDMDYLFDQYLMATDITNRAMQWGIDHEAEAIEVFEAVAKQSVTACGCIRHPSLDCFADSPDGLLLDEGGVVEVKCPSLKQHVQNAIEVTDGEGLKAVNDTYYWQVMAHMAVTGADFCAWLSYNPFAKPSLIATYIERSEDEIGAMLERIKQADALCNDMVAKIRPRGKIKAKAVKCV